MLVGSHSDVHAGWRHLHPSLWLLCGGKGRSRLADAEEPRHVAEAVRHLDLAHTVITSVNRDDLPDGGAAHWAKTIRQVRSLNPECKVEVLIPDFNGDEAALNAVLDARPDVLNHNTETIARLYRRVGLTPIINNRSRCFSALPYGATVKNAACLPRAASWSVSAKSLMKLWN